MIEIKKLEETDLESVREIFFLSTSVKSFTSEEHKESFFKRWCGDYISLYPEQFYVMKEIETKFFLGYLSGCKNSIAALEKLEIPGFEIFKDYFHLYPAHLHINFHPDSRGRGLGSRLVEHYVRDLRMENIHGLHLVTSPNAANISFYRRAGFSFEDIRVFGKNQLLFMGMKLC
jgi:ribosomal protein S18 acetylase RimI-like enzyme